MQWKVIITSLMIYCISRIVMLNIKISTINTICPYISIKLLNARINITCFLYEMCTVKRFHLAKNYLSCDFMCIFIRLRCSWLLLIPITKTFAAIHTQIFRTNNHFTQWNPWYFEPANVLHRLVFILLIALSNSLSW